MALTESQIKVIIAAELQKAGFDKADRAAKNLTKTFQKLGATIGVALSARALVNFAKQGAVAFANEEKAVKQLTNSLANLGFAFSVPAIERYLENVEKATMVSKDELRPAMVQLISTTMSAQKSMGLLSTALDIAAETGADVGAVTTALSRAYNGNYSSIAKLSKGYTAAQLKAAGFSTTIELLNERFSGSAAAATDSYSFKIAQLQKAVGDAQKEIGKGLIAGLEQLGSGDYDEGLQDLVDFGTSIGKSFGYAAGAVQTLKQAYDLITLRPVRDLTSQLLGKQQQQQLGGTTTPTQFELAKAAVERRKEKALRDAERRDREKLRKLESAERRKREAALRKEAQLKRAGTVFDMENIQIVAAMQGKLTEEQRLRLTALLAINNDNAEAAEKLTLAILASNKAAFEALGVTMKAGDSVETLIQKIVKAQTGILLVNSGITDIKKAKNPFEDWPDIIAGILAGISNVKKAVASIGGGTGSAAGVTDNAGGGGGAKAITPPVNSGSVSDWRRKEAQDAEDFPMPVPVSPEVSDEHLRRKAAAIPKVEPLPEIPGFGGGGGGRGTQQILNLSVNVSGSVMTENDLVNSITNAIYNKQKSGQPINYTAAI